MHRSLASPYLLLTMTALFWAGSVITGRAMADEVPPFALNFWRWLIALALAARFGLRGLWVNRRIVGRHRRLLTMQTPMASDDPTVDPQSTQPKRCGERERY